MVASPLIMTAVANYTKVKDHRHDPDEVEESSSFKHESGKKTILFRGESVIHPSMFI